MDWNRAVVIGAGCVVVVVLGVCVGLGHNSAVTDGLLAASGLVTGGSLVSAVAKTKAKSE